MHKIAVPLPDTLWLYDHLRGYANPRAKIVGLERKKELIRLKRGLYITADAAADHFPIGCIANRLYGPSYVSFAYALRLYNLIPEYVPNVTSATRGKRRTKQFRTSLGVFFYRDVPDAVFHKAITYREENQARYLVAAPEKALCDELSTVGPLRSSSALERLLFEDLRIDPDELDRLDRQMITGLAPQYNSTAVTAFERLMRKLQHEKRT
jgi:hypothetical protein